ncbi:hypothetical protein BN1723_008325 [Verticillium longisporum]|uniref:Uncharacterized protein n=1 Tax=Verticillium longisporum TaxID=100787 RepID=A0A0G4NRD4_VERLO|nr:hypothetical protein BN1723_008325 [Verticillium longisporum]
MADSDDQSDERDPQNDGYRGIRSCSTHAEALAAMEDDLDSHRTGENAELKSEVALLLRDFYDKIDKYAKPPAAHRDIVYVRSIKKALDAAIQHREAGEAFSHRLPSSAQMLALRYTHQSGTLEEDVCAVLVDYQVQYGAPVPFLGFGYTAMPVHELLLATPVQPTHVMDEHDHLAAQHATPSEEMKDQLERREEQQSEQNDVASVQSEAPRPTMPVEEDPSLNFGGPDAEFDQMDFNAWNLQRTMKLRQDLQGLREMTAETTTAQRAEIDALKTHREETAYLLSILLRQMQEYRGELRALKAQVAVPTPPHSQHSRKRSVDTSVLKDETRKKARTEAVPPPTHRPYDTNHAANPTAKTATSVLDKQLGRIAMLRDEIQASKQCFSLCEPLCAEKDRASTNTNDGPHASASTEVSYTEVPDRAIERDTVNPKRAEPPQGQKAAPKTRPPLDPNSKEYKKEYNSLTRRWTAGLIAMPILLVTSYYLFDRIILGHEKKELHRFHSSKNPDESPIKSF